MAEPTPEMIERTASAIYGAWAKETSAAASWDEVVRLGHSCVRLARLEARAVLDEIAPDFARERQAAMEETATRVEKMRLPESGPDYGMMNDRERAETRGYNRTLQSIAAEIRAAAPLKASEELTNAAK